MHTMHKHAPRFSWLAKQTSHACCSGHAKQSELEEVLKLVKPQHFLPVHGEAAFLYKHAELAQELGCRNTTVIRNGQMFGCAELSNREFVSGGSAAKVRVPRAAPQQCRENSATALRTCGVHVMSTWLQVLGEAKLEWLYNDGTHGTGTGEEMALVQRGTLAQEGIVIAAVDVGREFDAGGGDGSLNITVRVTTRGMWTGDGQLLKSLHQKSTQVASGMPASTRCALSATGSLRWCFVRAAAQASIPQLSRRASAADSRAEVRASGKSDMVNRRAVSRP